MKTAEQLSRLNQAIEQTLFLNRAILKREGVTIYEELNEESKEQYDENLATLRQLNNFRRSIESLLNNAIGFITTNAVL